ncbi:MAG: FUSC family protein [Solirubrobacteraceae bacterium]|nr:FUSC family protein [Solirubrobacteraceae bacterium]
MSSPIATGRAGLEVTGSLTRAMVEGARRTRPERGRLGKSVRIVICVVGPLAIGLAVDRIAVGLAVSFGGFAGFHGHVEPYPQRARLVGAMVLAYTLAVLAGTAAQGSDLVAVLVTGVFATGAAFVCQALALPAPREYMLVLICLLVGALPASPAPPPEMAGWALLGGTWAWIVLMSGWLTDRERPEREALRAALRAIIRLVGSSSDNRAARRHDAVLATRTARRAVEFAGGPTAPLLRRLQLETEDQLDAVLALFGPRAGATNPDPGTTGDLRRIALRRHLGQLISETDAALPRLGFRRAPRDPGRPPLRSGFWSLRNAMGSDSLVPPTALRFGVAVAGGLAIGALVGLPRPYWIALTTAAVMQGATLLTTARRAIERAAGTALGIAIAAGIVAADPGAWAIVGGVALFLFLTEMTIAASYVIAVICITPMTLLLSEVGAPGALTDSLLGWRLADTLVGCVVAILAGRLLWPSRARQQLDAALARALDGIAALLDATDAERTGAPLIGSTTAKWMMARTGPSDDELRARRMAAGRGRRGRAAASRTRREATAEAHAAADRAPETPHARSERRSQAQRALRHDLRVRLLNLRSVTDSALGDRFTSAPREDELWPIAAAVQQAGFRALALQERDTADLRREVGRLRVELAGR